MIKRIKQIKDKRPAGLRLVKPEVWRVLLSMSPFFADPKNGDMRYY